MFASMKKKLEAEVGDLSRLTPSLRSITHSERMTPLSSRHNSVSSLTSETSHGNKLISSPTSPFEQQSPPFTQGKSAADGTNGSNKAPDGMQQQKIRRQYEEKLQTQELDFADRLNNKDDEISKLTKQVDHLNSLLHSKEFETQQKLVRVQEDMDSLEGFSQQENAKIKHLLLNREEELSQLRAAVMFKDSKIMEFESQVKSTTVENERLRKSLDEAVSRTQSKYSEQDEEKIAELDKLHKEQLKALDSSKKELEIALKAKDEKIEKLFADLKTAKHDADSVADGLRKENSLVLKELKEFQIKLNKIAQEGEKSSLTMNRLEEELSFAKKALEVKNEELSEAIFSTRKLQEQNGELTLKLAAVASENNNEDKEDDPLLIQLQSDLAKLKGVVADFENDVKTKELQVQALVRDLSHKKAELEAQQSKYTLEKTEHVSQYSKLENQLKDKDALIQDFQQQIHNFEADIQKFQSQSSSLQKELNSKDSQLQIKSSELESVQKELSHLEIKLTEKASEQEHKLTSSSESLGLLEKQLEEKKSEILQLQSQLSKLSNFKKENSEIVSKLESQLNDKDVVVQNCQKQIQNLEAEIQNIQSEAESFKEKLEIKNSQNENKTSEFESMQKDLITKSEALNRLENQLEEKESAILQFQTRLSELSSLKTENKEQLFQYESKLKEKDALIQNFQQQIKSLESEIKMSQLETASIREELELQHSQNENKSKELESVKKEFSYLETKLAEKESQNENEFSSKAEALSQLEKQLDEKETTIAELQSTISELSGFEIENSELVLQISEIQSKCDELEEENKFLKDSVPNEDPEALKRKVSDMEGELLDKTQMLKQQSLQLQDLRRSLAKEINKNQALSESASPAEVAVPQQMQNGAINGSQTISSSSPQTSTQPPTLPPQETDVNFMYLRSVMFKFLTTTDAQVTHQLTRVVATLLHLNEEESHLLSQATESRNGFFHTLGKS